ncbi:MAG: hypothetical protein ACKER6_00185 [Candidatus Hodgkinia cicadicola]
MINNVQCSHRTLWRRLVRRRELRSNVGAWYCLCGVSMQSFKTMDALGWIAPTVGRRRLTKVFGRNNRKIGEGRNVKD